MTFKILTILAAGCLLGLPSARADFSAHQCLGPRDGSVRAVRDGEVCTGFVHKGKQVDFDFVGSGKLVASDDGRTVVMLQSYLPGRVLENGAVVEFVKDREVKNPVVIYVYRDGKKVASHRIGDIIKRKGLLGQSVSHVGWLRNAPDAIAGKTFKITTSSFRTLELDTRTGRILNAEDSVDWKDCDVIATGQLDLPGKTLKKALLLKTLTHSKSALKFELHPSVDVDSLTNKASTTACFESEGKKRVLVRTL